VPSWNPESLAHDAFGRAEVNAYLLFYFREGSRPASIVEIPEDF
jgi:hypothetical protein